MCNNGLKKYESWPGGGPGVGGVGMTDLPCTRVRVVWPLKGGHRDLQPSPPINGSVLLLASIIPSLATLRELNDIDVYFWF